MNKKLASIRWVWLTFSSLRPLFRAVPSINLSNIKINILGNAENHTRGSCVRSKSAISVQCSPLLFIYFWNKNTHLASLFSQSDDYLKTLISRCCLRLQKFPNKKTGQEIFSDPKWNIFYFIWKFVSNLDAEKNFNGFLRQRGERVKRWNSRSFELSSKGLLSFELCSVTTAELVGVPVS